MGDSSRGGKVHVPANQSNADHRTGYRTFHRFCVHRSTCALNWLQAESPELVTKHTQSPLVESAERHWSGNWLKLSGAPGRRFRQSARKPCHLAPRFERTGAGQASLSNTGNHFADRTNPGQGLGRERIHEGHRTGQAPVNVDRATAHAGHHSGLADWAAVESAKNHGCLWAREILQHTQNLDVELLDPSTGKDRPADAPLTGTNLLYRKEVLARQDAREQQQ